MKILALEFSSPQRSVAAAVSGEAGGLAASEVIEPGASGTGAIAMIEEVLRQSKLEREQIECVAVGLGPGSYTGIRAAIALAQGWQLASRQGGLKVLGISSAECLAAQARAEGLRGTVSVVIDAQRNEVYLAQYEIHSSGYREIEPLRLARLVEIQRERAGEVLAGPEITRWVAGGRTVFPRAAMLARLAMDRNNFVAAEKLEPIYLRETNFIKAPPPRVL